MAYPHHTTQGCSCCAKRNKENIKAAREQKLNIVPVQNTILSESNASYYRSAKLELHSESRYIDGGYSPVRLSDTLGREVHSTDDLLNQRTEYPPFGELSMETKQCSYGEKLFTAAMIV